jgi:hypothetical protein
MDKEESQPLSFGDGSYEARELIWNLQPLAGCRGGVRDDLFNAE